VGEIEAMPMSEYLEWQEFYAIEPFGLQVDDAFHAHQISVLANIKRDAKKRKEPFSIRDFLLHPEPEPSAPKVEPTVEGKTAAQWRAIFAADAINAARRMKKQAGIVAPSSQE
jgi:hypothetical protein